jgi:hypothetical protein
VEKNINSKKPWYKRVWVWIGIVVLLVIVASALSPKETPKLADGSSTSADSSQKSEQTTFEAGDTIEFDGKKVTVAAPERNWDSGNQFITPQTGNEFLKVQVTIENNSNSEAMYNTFDWKLQDSKGVIKDVASAAYSVDGALNSGQLAPKGKVSGFLVFEVPTGDTSLTLRYNPSFWSDKKVEIKL